MKCKKKENVKLQIQQSEISQITTSDLLSTQKIEQTFKRARNAKLLLVGQLRSRDFQLLLLLFKHMTGLYCTSSHIKQQANCCIKEEWILLSSARVCPDGLLTGVPETTTEDDRPWYPTGRCFLKKETIQKFYRFTFRLLEAQLTFLEVRTTGIILIT